MFTIVRILDRSRRIAAQNFVMSHLLSGEQRAHAAMCLQVGEPELALRGCCDAHLRCYLGFIRAGIPKEFVKLALGADDLCTEFARVRCSEDNSSVSASSSTCMGPG